MKVIAFLMKHAHGCRRYLLQVFGNVLLYVICGLVYPLIISLMIDHVIGNAPMENGMIAVLGQLLGGTAFLKEHMWIGAVTIILVNGLCALAMFRRSYLSGKLGEHLANRLGLAMYDHLQKLPDAYHKSHDSGDLIQRSTSDIEQIRRFLGVQIAEMMNAVFMVLCAAFILGNLHLRLMGVAVSIMPLLMFIGYVFFTKAKKIFLTVDEAEGAMTTVLQENLNATRVVKAFHRERYEIEKFEEVNESFRKKLFELMHALGIYWSATDFLCMGQILLVTVVGIFMARSGEITVGNLFVFVTYESMIVWPMRQLGRILADMGKVSVAVGRLSEVLDAPAEDLESGERNEIRGEIVFDHVSFAYEDDQNHVLRDLSFTIHAKQRVAIMGPTGSGKSSLVQLLVRMQDYEGSIKIDGVELRNIAKEWIRSQIRIVLQEPFLFSKTIEENIALAKRDASFEEIRHAARIASIHEDIEGFDQGYATAVGEKGVTLSGGQKQRIAIARTILDQPPVLIFDDSLSALDMQTDARIQQALQALKGDLTMIMITHRVSSAMHADQIIVLENGRIVQSGTHAELMKEEGLYRRIAMIQNEGGEEAWQQS